MNLSEPLADNLMTSNRAPIPPLSGSVVLVGFSESACDRLTDFLERHGFEVNRTTASGLQDEIGKSLSSPTILLDLDSVPPEGLAILREIRLQTITPIVATTNQDNEIDRILALEMGADDCLGGQYSCRELLARIRAVQRRARSSLSSRRASGLIEDGDLVIDRDRHSAYLDGTYLALTNAEFRILERLMLAGGRVVARSELAEYALGRDLAPQDRCIDTHICRLRRKLNSGHGNNRRIQSVRGRGYLMPRTRSARNPAGV